MQRLFGMMWCYRRSLNQRTQLLSTQLQWKLIYTLNLHWLMNKRYLTNPLIISSFQPYVSAQLKTIHLCSNNVHAINARVLLLVQAAVVALCRDDRRDLAALLPPSLYLWGPVYIVILCGAAMTVAFRPLGWDDLCVNVWWASPCPTELHPACCQRFLKQRYVELIV